jgi:hypothetical protein
MPVSKLSFAVLPNEHLGDPKRPILFRKFAHPAVLTFNGEPDGRSKFTHATDRPIGNRPQPEVVQVCLCQ